jgi:transposase
MTTPEIYTSLLRLSLPWYISRIDVDVVKEEAHVYIDHHHEKMPCPVCAVKCNIRDHSEGERVWRHLDLWQAKTFIHASMPRIECKTHGVLTVPVPWAEPNSRFSMGFEARVILALLATKTVEGARELMRISWDEARGIMERAVERGLLDREDLEIPYLAADEKSYRKGRRFVTILMDLERNLVHSVSAGNSQESLQELLEALTKMQKMGVEAIALDMYDPYRAAVDAVFPVPRPRVVHDKFHIVSQMNKALNDVRIEEARELSKQGDNSLKGTRQMILYGEENVPKRYKRKFSKLKKSELKTAEVHAQKEVLRHLWDCSGVREARRYFKEWAKWCRESAIPRVMKVVDMIASRLDDVISFCNHPISTGPLEGMNSIIMAIRRAGRGYHRADTFGMAIMFFCGGLNLMPVQSL